MHVTAEVYRRVSHVRCSDCILYEINCVVVPSPVLCSVKFAIFLHLMLHIALYLRYISAIFAIYLLYISAIFAIFLL